MKKLILSIPFILGSLFTFAQQDEYETMPYVYGELLIMVDHNDNIQTVVEAHRNVNGIMTELTLVKAASEPANIWLLQFNNNSISHLEMIREMYTDAHVVIAQNNHLVTERATVPDDTQFGSLWYHDDGGSDNDIDSELAWDITTGGTTANGDEIVVAVLEGGGAQWQHQDLIDNHWVNTNEIPNNGTDDDANGYTDDYDGWNLAGNDNIATGGHGTGVSSMIGATGNNSTNVVGANWNVKIMQVDMSGGLTESNVIASYTYPLVMRQMYTNTNGASGAFVVATNASWGIDNGDPASAPLWCAFYDTLGYYGILNMGATANNNVNIDVVGDLPTACGSDYMISVTATNNADVRTFSGYGQTTIDLGAPGQNVLMAYGSGTTGTSTLSGTSFATPLTAGVAALMYSVPCTNLADMAMQDPQGAADIIRSALFSGVDPVANLTTETVTGGRLNAFNSVSIINTDCSTYLICSGSFFVTPTVTNASCNGVCDGTITVAVTGGSGTYTYDIGSGAQASNTFTGLCANAYTINVDDGVNCNTNINPTVTEPTAISITTVVTNQVTGNDGAIDATISGGTAPYVIGWTGPNSFSSSTEDISGLEAGTYIITVTDANGCTNNINVDVSAVAGVSENQLNFTIYPNPADEELMIQLDASGTFNLTLIDNSGRIVQQQVLLNKNNTIDVSQLAAGIYTIKLTSNEGLIAIKKLVIE
jgi:Subtilase family/Secretion system C-terminal sorting domain/SprB repeat